MREVIHLLLIIAQGVSTSGCKDKEVHHNLAESKYIHYPCRPWMRSHRLTSKTCSDMKSLYYYIQIYLFAVGNDFVEAITGLK